MTSHQIRVSFSQTLQFMRHKMSAILPLSWSFHIVRCKQFTLGQEDYALSWSSKKMTTNRPPNIISISKSSLKFHSQYLQYLTLFLMEHPILKIPGCLAIIKLQKRSESNVLTNFSSYRNRRLSKWWNPTTSWSNPWSLEWLANRSRVISLRAERRAFYFRIISYILIKLPPWPELHVDQSECHNDTSQNLVLF